MLSISKQQQRVLIDFEEEGVTNIKVKIEHELKGM